MRYPPWKTALILGICALGFLLTLPNFVPQGVLDRLPDPFPKGRIVLGLDLQGGSSLLLEVQTGAIVKERLENLVNDVRANLREARIGYRGLGAQGETVVFTLTDPAQAEAARAKVDEANPRLANAVGFGASNAREFETAVEANGRFVLSFSEQSRAELTRQAVEQSVEVVRRRIDELGTREASIQRQGADRILVQVPGERDPENIKRLLGRTARLTFHMVDMDNSLAEALAGRVPPGSFVAEADDGEGQERYLLKRRVEVTGESLTDSQPSFQENQPVVSFRFDGAGARAFGRITQENVGKLFAILLDDKVISAPRIREPILGGSGIISGSFTTESANELSVLLRSGALPAPLDVIEERSVGAELGADSIRAGVIASAVASVLVVALITYYYGVLGVIANVALVVNVVLVLACMSALGGTLTLPGIAGLILTIGTAVDSNVLIYERIREEARNGKSPIASINSGFDEAIRTIVDANITTLIAALALFQFGTGPVKGFAVTLGLGIIANMFTAVAFTRLLVALWFRRARPAAVPL